MNRIDIYIIITVILFFLLGVYQLYRLIKYREDVKNDKPNL